MNKDVHPEDLLARAASGSLSEEERHTLELHLAGCPGCRAHRLLANDAALPLGSADQALLVRAENAALAREHRSRALPDRARAPRDGGALRLERGGAVRGEPRVQSGKPRH
jgi:hypothetical protein